MNQKALLNFILVMTLIANLTGNAANINDLSIQNQSEWQWTATELLSTESTNTAISPSLAIDSINNIHVVWHDTSGAHGIADIVYKKFDAITHLWTETEVVSTQSTLVANSASIAIDSKDNVHIVWDDWTDYNKSGEDVDIFYKKYDVEKKSWTITEVVSTESTEQSTMPTIAIDSKDNIHVVWNDLSSYLVTGSVGNIFYRKYNATSQYWTTTELISSEYTINTDLPSIAIDNNDNLHFVWEDYNFAKNSYDIYYKKYNSTAQLWSVTDIISTESSDTSHSATVAADSKGNIHVVWHDLTNFSEAGAEAKIFYKKFEVTTQEWSTTKTISSDILNKSFFPSITIDTDDNIHFVWQVHSSDSFNINYMKFNETTQLWSATEIISTQSDKDSKHPAVAIDSENIIHVVWSDITNYNSVDNGMYDIFYKKFSPRQQPILLEDIQPGTSNGTIDLDWEYVFDVTYSVYRDVATIISTNGLTKIAETNNAFYTDELNSSGKYYYVITANTDLGAIIWSNTVSVEVTILTTEEVLTIFNRVIASDRATEIAFLNLAFIVPMIFTLIPMVITRRKIQNKNTGFINSE